MILSGKVGREGGGRGTGGEGRRGAKVMRAAGRAFVDCCLCGLGGFRFWVF